MNPNHNHQSADQHASSQQKSVHEKGIPKLSLQPSTPLPASGWVGIPVTNGPLANGPRSNRSNAQTIEPQSARLPLIIPDSNHAGAAAMNGSQSARDGPFKRPQAIPNHSSARIGATNTNLAVTRMKEETNDTFSCMGMSMHHQQVPANTPANGTRHSANRYSNMELQIRGATPAMSDISSINANTPRGSTHSNRTSFSSTKAGDYLQPGRYMRGNSWSNYNVLPEVGQRNSPPEHNAMLAQQSRSSLSPSIQLPEFPQADNNPIHHGPKGLKRARSTSTQSSDFDIMSVIRFSPSNLRPVNYPGSTRGSSMNSSPQPTYFGSCGHLDARHSALGPAPMMNERRVNNFMVQESGAEQQNDQWEVYKAMSALENNMRTGQQTGMANHMVITQPDMCMYKQVHQGNMYPQPQLNNMTYKQEPVDTYGSQQPMNNMHIGHMSEHGHHQHHNGANPPPPYPQNGGGGMSNDMSQLSPYDAASQSQDQSSEIKTEPEEPQKEEFKCEWIDCNLIFADRSELVTHLEKQHIDQRRGEDFTCFWRGCTRQEKPFNARYKLLIHMRVHSGERPNKCTFEGCDKAFSRLENLKIHLRSHTGERPYQCTFEGCTKAFSNSSDRAKHQRTHIDMKPYACNFPNCPKRYTDPSSLRKHVKTHNNKDTPIRKKHCRDGESAAKDNSNALGNCMTVQSMKNGQQEKPQQPKLYQPGMQFGKALAYTEQAPAPQLPAHLAPENFDRRVGGGFNPAAFNSSLMVPRNRGHDHNQSIGELPQTGLHGTRVPMVGEVCPPPPPYPEQDQQWQQPPQEPTPNPEMDVPVPSPMEHSPGPAQQYEQVQGPYLSAELNQMQPPTTFSRPHRHYVPQEGNAPISQDYTGMPCHLQAGPFTGQQSNFQQLPMTIDETLRNLPFDTVPFQRAVSNHSGGGMM